MIAWFWKFIAGAAFLAGFIGIVVPGLPTVPFWILSAWAAGKGWPTLERWLLNHPKFGDGIRQWREKRIVPRQAKIIASVTMLLSAVAMQFTSAPIFIRYGVPTSMLLVAFWLWRRPET